MNTPGNISGHNGGGGNHRQHQQQNDHQFHDLLTFSSFIGECSGLDELMNRVVKPDPGVDSSWPGFGGVELGYGYGYVPGFGHMNQSTLPTVADQIVLQGNSGSSKKRKADLKVVSVSEDGANDKRIKGCAEEGDSKITHQYSNKGGNCDNKNKSCNSRETSADNLSKEKSKASEVQKQDYIHVRARRGQATDSHSLAERVRREKISERMKYLQDLVPGCNKITGKAGMIDEIINYVQSLQR